eukprot:gene10675-12364_t
MLQHSSYRQCNETNNASDCIEFWAVVSEQALEADEVRSRRVSVAVSVVSVEELRKPREACSVPYRPAGTVLMMNRLLGCFFAVVKRVRITIFGRDHFALIRRCLRLLILNQNQTDVELLKTSLCSMGGLCQRLAPEPVASCSSSFSCATRASSVSSSYSARISASPTRASSYPYAAQASIPFAPSSHLAACSSSGALPSQLQSSGCRLGGISSSRWTRLGCRQSMEGRQNLPYDEEDYPLEIPTKFELMQRPDKQKPLVRVRLTVHFRVHSRQMLCIGGSQIPMGWSFLSISRVPMTWNSGDNWTVEVRLIRRVREQLYSARVQLCSIASAIFLIRLIALTAS